MKLLLKDFSPGVILMYLIRYRYVQKLNGQDGPLPKMKMTNKIFLNPTNTIQAMKESNDDKKSKQQDNLDQTESTPKTLSQIFKEMPYTDKRGKGFVMSIHKLPEQNKINKVQDDIIEDDK